MSHVYLGRPGPGRVIPNAGTRVGFSAHAMPLANDWLLYTYNYQPPVDAFLPYYLGDTARLLNTDLPRSLIGVLNTELEVQLVERNFYRVIEELLEDHADAVSTARWNPVIGDRRHGFGAFIEGGFIPFRSGLQAQKRVERFRADYERDLLRVRDGFGRNGKFLSVDDLRTYTYSKSRDWRIDYKELLPIRFQADPRHTPLRPGTTVTEDGSSVTNFTADANTWDSASGVIRHTSTSGEGCLVHDTDLGADNMQGEALIGHNNPATFCSAVMLRHDTGSTGDAYGAGSDNGFGGNDWIIEYYSGHSLSSQLVNTTESGGNHMGQYHLFLIEDDTLTLYMDSTSPATTQRVQTTDANLSGASQRSIGLYCHQNSFSQNTFDDMEWTDNLGGGGAGFVHSQAVIIG